MGELRKQVADAEARKVLRQLQSGARSIDLQAAQAHMAVMLGESTLPMLELIRHYASQLVEMADDAIAEQKGE